MTDCATLPLSAAAERLGISRGAAYKQVRKGTFPLPVLRVGGSLKVSRVQLEAFLASEPEAASA